MAKQEYEIRGMWIYLEEWRLVEAVIMGQWRRLHMTLRLATIPAS
ncbi:MAG: hypothetical protein ACLTDI_12680 [Acutalibacteraceae bacterium]